jgi:hypothetical protein
MAALTPPLSSQWLGLSRHLLAAFYEIKRDGKDAAGSDVWVRADPRVSVEAPLSESSIEATLNWQSPFEHAGSESKAPMLMAMLQSGALQPLVDAVVKAGTATGAGAGIAADAQKKSSEFLKQFEGRTGITKLNSVQVFTGMPPVKISVTAVFRAWADTEKEVEAPVAQLWLWALPVKLADNSTILSRGVDVASGSGGWIDVLMPSMAPVTIAMRYKGRTYQPLVIESIGDPIGSPVTARGGYVEKAIPLTLSTLAAVDRKDWGNLRKSA